MTMRRHVNATGPRAVAGRNHEGRKVHKVQLGPTSPAFDPGSTRERPSLAKMNASGTTTTACWCGRGFVEATLDEVHAGTTRSCRRKNCGPTAVAS